MTGRRRQRGAARAAMALLAALGLSAAARSDDRELLPGLRSSASEAGETVDARDINLGFPQVPSETIRPLIERLSSWKFAERQQAAKELAALGPGTFSELSRTYRTVDDFEVRLQIEDVVREQFLWHSLLKHKGFLGIGYAPTQAIVGGSGEPRWVIAVNLVRPDSAAADAGIRENDLVVGVDGKPLEQEPGQESFRDLIGLKGAGARIVLDIQRGGERRQVEVTLRARPLSEYNSTPLAEELGNHLQTFSAWWGRHFSLPARRTERSPSSSVIELPE